MVPIAEAIESGCWLRADNVSKFDETISYQIKLLSFDNKVASIFSLRFTL